jgi:hypothetical protein
MERDSNTQRCRECSEWFDSEYGEFIELIMGIPKEEWEARTLEIAEGMKRDKLRREKGELEQGKTWKRWTVDSSKLNKEGEGHE